MTLEAAVFTDRFAAAMAEAEKLIVEAAHIQTEQDLLEGLEYLAGGIRASMQFAFAYGRDFPYFSESTGPYMKMGLDNPDTLYYSADIRDNAEYVVTGTRGSAADLNFQVMAGHHTPNTVPDSPPAFDDRAIEIGADGTYEVRFGPAKPGAGPNYVTLPGRPPWWCARCSATGLPSNPAGSGSSAPTAPGSLRRRSPRRSWRRRSRWPPQC